ncbi:cold-shock protein [Mesorhizobium sp. Cs1299R1N1]|uniref:cold-shock protein n=1 Tax=unclassified Mesorhizobium TaxID=325217 RepID=UPI00301D0289
MSRYRDHRKPRRHWNDDEPASFSERPPEPSYFQRPPPMSVDPVDAEVKWFDVTKGFGFVKLLDGRDAYLPSRVLELAGSRSVSQGTRLKVAVEERSKGPQVTQLLEIDEVAKTSPPAHRAEGSVSAVGGTTESAGTVRWYNPKKGFGFIAAEDGSKDVFVHATVLTDSGLTNLVEGQKVMVQCRPGKKGLEVHSIRIA